MKTQLIILALLLPAVGCGTLKEATGEYVTEAAKDDIAKRIDVILEKRGLSIGEFKKVTDANDDGDLTREEIYGTVKDITRDYVMLEAKNYVDGKLGNHATKGEVESAGSQFFQWLLGLISLYLGKQLYSQRGDHKRDQKIALLEKIIHKDLDGDGNIGGVPEPDVNPEEIV
jgi:hypothetical protein